jgi:hypothetical protein
MSSKSGMTHPFLNEAIQSDSPHPNRRRWARSRVHWPLLFQGEHGAIVETITDNLSSDGFYCVADAPFVPGKVFDCTLSVPAYYPDDVTRMISVLCRVRVVRVETLGRSGLFGVGCCIEDYQVHSV